MRYCDRCELCKTSNGPVSDVGPVKAIGMCCGEAPGHDEDKYNIPFCGKAGNELTRALELAGLRRSDLYITNVVKCRPPGNADPKKEYIESCSYRLIEALNTVKPKVIAAIGRISAQFFLGDDLSMEYIHGIPFKVSSLPNGTRIPETIVVPCYHPAAGFRNTSIFTYVFSDIKVFAGVLKGRIQARELNEYKGDYKLTGDYKLITNPDEIPYNDVVAVDTEWAKGKPWCVTFSVEEGSAYMVMADDKPCIAKLKAWFESDNVLCIIHNSLYDIGVLDIIGIHPKNVADTMIMAYLLQDEPLGLKPLGYRVCGIRMREYEDVVRGSGVVEAVKYLGKVLSLWWNDPEHKVVNGKTRCPSNISKRVKSILNDIGCGLQVDAYRRWKSIPEDEGRGEVEETIGAMPVGNLSEVRFEDALTYACMDSDVLMRVYPYLWSRIVDKGLEDVFWVDMKVVRMVSDMMKNGIKIDRGVFNRLRDEFKSRSEFYGALVNAEAGYHVNTKSSIQVCDLLINLGVFKHPQSTEAKNLERFREKHPVVDHILNQRAVEKLISTYVDVIPNVADENGRVHTKFSVTGTATGRLTSSDPNLMNQPVRSEDGRAIRAGFIAEDGNMLVEFDFSQIELRVLAHESRDQGMVECYLSGGDIHVDTARRICGLRGLNWDDLSDSEKDEMRYNSKRINFGIVYGLSAFGLYKELSAKGANITEEECEEIINEWFSVRPGVAEWISKVKKFAKKNGYVKDMFGRIRLCYEVFANDISVRSSGERKAINSPIQSGAQGIIKRAMAKLPQYYTALSCDGKYCCLPLIQIHDSLLFEVSEEILDLSIQVIKSIMETAVELCVPTPVDVKVGKNWGNMNKLREANI